MNGVVEWLKSALLELQEYTRLAGATARGAVTRPFYWHDFIEQLDAIGIGSMTVVVLTGLFTGAVLALQSGFTLDQFGARPFVGRLVSASMIKELGPVLTALMLAGRVSSGIAAELGSMTVTDQINALRALGTDPVRKLVVPRVLAGILMTPILTVVANTVGLIGGWLVSVQNLHVASGLYWSSVVDGLFLEDVWMGILKPFFLGFIIVTVGCHVGLRTRGGTEGVGRATTNAVVAASVGGHRHGLLLDAAAAVAAVLMQAYPDELRGPAKGRPGDEPVVVFEDVRLAFDDNVVLDGISFKMFPGFTKIFLGASGSGKSTVLKLMLGLLAPDSGRIWVHGVQIDRMSEEELLEGARPDRDGVPGGRAVRLADRRRERRLQVLRGDAHAARRGAAAGRGSARLRRARSVSSTGCRRSSRAVSVAASPSPGRWPSSRSCCSTTSRRPVSTR